MTSFRYSACKKQKNATSINFREWVVQLNLFDGLMQVHIAVEIIVSNNCLRRAEKSLSTVHVNFLLIEHNTTILPRIFGPSCAEAGKSLAA